MSKDSKYRQLLSCLGSKSQPNIHEALSAIRSKMRKEKDCTQILCRLGFVVELVRLLRTSEVTDTPRLDLLFSILSNMCMEKCARKAVVGVTSSIPTIVEILEETEVESVKNRSCRLLANLAQEVANSDLIMATEAPQLIATFMKSTEDKECKKTCCRAFRLLGSTEKHTRKIAQEGGVFPVAALLKEEDPDLVDNSLRALAELSNRCSVECANQIQNAGAIDKLVELAQEKNPSTRQYSLVMKILMNLTEQPNARPSVGNAGGITLFLTLFQENRKPSIKCPLLNALCLFCHESVNRVRIRELGILDILMSALQDDSLQGLHGQIVRAFVCFIHDEPSLKLLLAKGLIGILLGHLQVCAAFSSTQNATLRECTKKAVSVNSGTKRGIQSPESCESTGKRRKFTAEENFQGNSEPLGLSAKNFKDKCTVETVQLGDEQFSVDVGHDPERIEDEPLLAAPPSPESRPDSISAEKPSKRPLYSLDSPTYEAQYTDFRLEDFKSSVKCKHLSPDRLSQRYTSSSRLSLDSSPTYPEVYSPLSVTSCYSPDYTPQYPIGGKFGSDTSSPQRCVSPSELSEVNDALSTGIGEEGNVWEYSSDENSCEEKPSCSSGHFPVNTREPQPSGGFGTSAVAMEQSQPPSSSVTSPVAMEQSQPPSSSVTSPVAMEQSQPTSSSVTSAVAMDLSQPTRSSVTSPVAMDQPQPTSSSVTSPVAMDLSQPTRSSVTSSVATVECQPSSGTVTSTCTVTAGQSQPSRGCVTSSVNTGQSPPTTRPVRSGVRTDHCQNQPSVQERSQGIFNTPILHGGPAKRNLGKSLGIAGTCSKSRNKLSTSDQADETPSTSKTSQNTRKKSLVCRTTEENILYLLSWVSQMDDPSKFLVTEDTLCCLLDYVKLYEKPNPRAGRILFRLVRNPHCLEALLDVLLPIHIVDKLHGGEIVKVAEADRTLTTEEFKTIADELRSPRKSLGSESDVSVEKTWSDASDLGTALLQDLRFVVESDYGRGTVAHVLRRKPDDQRIRCVLCLPFLCRSRPSQQKTLFGDGALRQLLDLLKTDTFAELNKVAVQGLYFLCCNSDVKLKLPEQTLPFPTDELAKAMSLSLVAEAGSSTRPLHSTNCMYSAVQEKHDVVFVLEGGVKCSANREVLVAACPVFQAMLKGDYSESRKSEIPLPQAAPQAFQFLLHFLHGCGPSCGAVKRVAAAHIPLEGFLDILSLADQNILFGLCKYLATIAKQEYLDISTVTQLYHFSVAHNYKILAEDCLRFLLTDNVSVHQRLCHVEELLSYGDADSNHDHLYQVLRSHAFAAKY